MVAAVTTKYRAIRGWVWGEAGSSVTIGTTGATAVMMAAPR